MHNKKAWMTRDIFQSWLEKVDKEFRSQDRHILLLLDNFSGHQAPDYRPTNVTMVFFAPNLTSYCQPLDQGIIATLKLCYHRLKAVETAAKVEAGEATPYDTNQLEAMIMLNKAWEEITSSTVTNCWRKAGILGDNLSHGQQAVDIPEGEATVNPRAWGIIFRLFDEDEYSIPQAEEALKALLGCHYDARYWQGIMAWSCVEPDQPEQLAEGRFKASVEQQARCETLRDQPEIEQLQLMRIELGSALENIGWSSATSRIAVSALLNETTAELAVEGDHALADVKQIDNEVFAELENFGSRRRDFEDREAENIDSTSEEEEDTEPEERGYGGDVSPAQLAEIRQAIGVLSSLATHRREEKWANKLLEGVRSAGQWERSYTANKTSRQSKLDSFIVRGPSQSGPSRFRTETSRDYSIEVVSD
jgi:hypothetical protein